jgi:hypothetical protein
MSLQIKSIVLYSQTGGIRELPFKKGAVNIITGKSGTGKSALIRIVEYCLGKSDFNVPEGIIRDNVSWYGVIFDLNDTDLFIAKPAPDPFAISQSSVYFHVGKEISPPPISELKTNTNDSALVQELSNRIGIAPNLNIPPIGLSRDSLEANIKHSHFYLFQEQSLISNENILFHQQSETYVPQAIKDTLPYFLGAVREDGLKLDQDLRIARRNLKLAQRSFNEAESIVSNNLSSGQALYAEAQQVGLLPQESTPTDSDEILASLAKTQQWKPSVSPPLSNERVALLQDQRNVSMI